MTADDRNGPRWVGVTGWMLLVRDETAERSCTRFVPLSGYGRDGPRPAQRRLGQAATFRFRHRSLTPSAGDGTRIAVKTTARPPPIVITRRPNGSGAYSSPLTSSPRPFDPSAGPSLNSWPGKAASLATVARLRHSCGTEVRPTAEVPISLR